MPRRKRGSCPVPSSTRRHYHESVEEEDGQAHRARRRRPSGRKRCVGPPPSFGEQESRSAALAHRKAVPCAKAASGANARRARKAARCDWKGVPDTGSPNEGSRRAGEEAASARFWRPLGFTTTLAITTVRVPLGFTSPVHAARLEPLDAVATFVPMVGWPSHLIAEYCLRAWNRLRYGTSKRRKIARNTTTVNQQMTISETRLRCVSLQLSRNQASKGFSW